MTHARVSSGGYTLSEPWTFMVPRRTGTFKPMLFLHGAGGEDATITNPGYPNLYRIMALAAEAGFAVLQPDGRDGISADGSHTWGNEGSTTGVDNALTYAQASLGAAAGPAVLFATSMGCITAWNFYRRFPTKVSKIVAVAGAASLNYHHSGQDAPTGKYLAEIEAAYVVGGGYATQAPTHDPLVFAGALADIPFRAYHDLTGDLVAPGAHIQTLAAAVGGTVVDLGAGGHTDTAWGQIDPTALVAFLQA